MQTIRLGYSTYLGGNSHDKGWAIAADSAGNAYVTGEAVTAFAPRYWPDVETTAEGPSVFHVDGSRVTRANPARAGEVLTMRAKGLGPTRPDLLPVGFKPFGASPLEEVNSPVEVTLGGVQAEVINKIGWPGTKDVYRLDIRVADGVAPVSSVYTKQ